MKDKESGSGLHYIILHPVKHTHNHFCILTKHTMRFRRSFFYDQVFCNSVIQFVISDYRLKIG